MIGSVGALWVSDGSFSCMGRGRARRSVVLSCLYGRRGGERCLGVGLYHARVIAFIGGCTDPCLEKCKKSTVESVVRLI